MYLGVPWCLGALVAKISWLGGQNLISLKLRIIGKMVIIDGKVITDNDWKLSWEETYREIAAENENWDDFDIGLMDGLPGEI